MSRGLTFRENTVDIKVRARIILLALIFFVSLVFFEFFLNRSENRTISSQKDYSLPIISVISDGRTYLKMHGYLSETDGCYMRESIVPLDKKGIVTIQIYDLAKKADK